MVKTCAKTELDVFEEHLDKASDALGQCAVSLDSSTTNLDGLASGPEPRLFAHLAVALDCAGTSRALLATDFCAHTNFHSRAEEPRASTSQAARITARVLASLHVHGPEVLWPALTHPSATVRDAAVQAGRLAGGARIDGWLRAQIPRAHSERARLGLLLLAAERRITPAWCDEALDSGEPLLIAAAARAAMHGEPELYLARVESLLGCALPEVRDAALLGPLAWRSPLACSVLERTALAEPAASPQLTALYAAIGSRAQHERLASLLSDARSRPAVLFALGCSGNPRMVAEILPWLASPSSRERKLAAQALSMIVGVDLFHPSHVDSPLARGGTARFDPSSADQDRHADARSRAVCREQELSLSEDALPEPCAAALERACLAWAARAQDGRYVDGVRYDVPQVTHSLARMPLRRAPVQSLALFIRSEGRLHFDARAFSRIQRDQLRQLRATPYRLLNDVFGPW